MANKSSSAIALAAIGGLMLFNRSSQGDEPSGPPASGDGPDGPAPPSGPDRPGRGSNGSPDSGSGDNCDPANLEAIRGLAESGTIPRDRANRLLARCGESLDDGGGQTPPPGSGGDEGPPTGDRTLTSFDKNGNNRVDDSEFNAISGAWSRGEISRELFERAKNKWLSQEPIDGGQGNGRDQPFQPDLHFFDLDGNGVLDDVEFNELTDAWAKGNISDDLFARGRRAWLNQTPINEVSATTVV